MVSAPATTSKKSTDIFPLMVACTKGPCWEPVYKHHSSTLLHAAHAHRRAELVAHWVPVVVIHRHADSELQRVCTMVTLLVPVVRNKPERAYGHPPRHCKEYRSYKKPDNQAAGDHACPGVPRPEQPFICITHKPTVAA